MVLGGTFTLARNDGEHRHQLTRNRLLAFDRDDRADQHHLPARTPTAPSTTVLPAGDGTTVYVGGAFTHHRRRGAPASSRGCGSPTARSSRRSTPAGDRQVTTCDSGRPAVAGRRLHQRRNGVAQPALATLNPTTGALVDPFRGTIDGHAQRRHHHVLEDGRLAPDGRGWSPSATSTPSTAVSTTRCSCWTSPARPRRRGLHTTVLRAGLLAARSTPTCATSTSRPTAPSSSSAPPARTAAPSAACDTTARWETGTTGTDVRPSWVDYTGGDTTYAVEVTDAVVYAGGHARWQNNPFAGDSAGPGAVPRPGIAALDPANGLPFSWNPGPHPRRRRLRLPGHRRTACGSPRDTDRIGDFVYHGRIALLPLRPGRRSPAVRRPTLPNDVYVAGPLGAATGEPERALPRQRRRTPARRPRRHRLGRRHRRLPGPFHNPVANRAATPRSAPSTPPCRPARREPSSTPSSWDPDDAPSSPGTSPGDRGRRCRCASTSPTGATAPRRPGSANSTSTSTAPACSTTSTSPRRGHNVGTVRSLRHHQ